MNGKMKKILLSIILISAIYSLKSMASYTNFNYSFKHFNINNGLSQNTVHAILQDKMGFIWFGTKDGLNKFDGSRFVIYKFSPDGTLSDNVFHRILQDKNDNIWVATDEGVYIYDVHTEEFHRFNTTTSENDSVSGVVTDMVADKDGDIWMSLESKGIFHYIMEKDELAFYAIPLVKDGMKMITLCPDNSNGVWVFPYSSPFMHINKKTKEITHFNLMDDDTFLHGTGEISDVFPDPGNVLLMSTSQKGLVAINTINRTHRVVLDKDSRGDPIFVRCVERIDPTTLWIGTESGVYIYHSDTGEVINLRHDLSLDNTLSDNAIYSIFKDRDGGIWVGSYFGGVDYFSNQQNNFELFYPQAGKEGLKGKRVREFCSAPGGKIWIGSEDGGLHLFDPTTGLFQELPKPLTSLYTNIHALFNDGDDLWIGTFSKGLHRYNLKTGKMDLFTHSDDPHSISQNSPFSLCKDRQGVFWVGTLAGVDIYDAERNQFNHVEELKGISIQNIFEDSYGYIWISTFLNGLFRFNPASTKWTHFEHDPFIRESLPYNKTTSVYEDGSGRLWVTTQGGGIGLFNREKETFTTYNSLNGLPNDVVYKIVDDQVGNLWFSTNSGLVCFDPNKRAFKNYTVKNGLKTNQFNYQSSFKTRDGMIYFGSLDGFVRFNPDDFIESPQASAVFFTDLYVNNLRINPKDENSPLSQSLIYTNSVILPHHQNSLSINIAHLNYAGTDTNPLYYTMQGFDKTWIPVRSNHTIAYSNLKPGHYHVKLGVAKEDGMEPIEQIASLSIRIKPPIWLNTWAYLVYIVIFFTALYFLIHFLNIRNKFKQKVKMKEFEQMKERELYKSKIKFFTNVAHEIRTPLTLIKAPLDHVLLTESVSDSVKDNLHIMSKNTDRLLNLTNQLLDFRKTESEAYLLHMQTYNATELLKETMLRYTPLAKQKNISVVTELPEQDIFMQMDKEAFLKIVSNLLNNAMKYGDHYVRLQASIQEKEQKKFQLLIENDGRLIPYAYKDEIFKPFVQIDSDKSNTTSGTGIGLALVTSLAELHGGSLNYLNDTMYNRFLLKLPVGDVETPIMANPEQEKSEISTDKVSLVDKKESTLLLVDDDLELLEFVANFLSKHYYVLTAKDGLQALEKLKKNTVNLVITDVMMPEMDGFELTQKLKTDMEISHIPVILLTAKVMAQSKVQGYELGADAYLEKPFSVEVLLARIENLLQSREKLRESFLKNPLIGASSVALNKSDEAFIRKLNEVIQENLSESDFNVEDMAERFNMSRASFYRKVKGVLDLTPNDYIRLERLKKAALLLKQNEYKVNEICYMVGFNSPSYFAKCFQQQFGILPKDFQDQR